jgi:hypothetical protein
VALTSVALGTQLGKTLTAHGNVTPSSLCMVMRRIRNRNRKVNIITVLLSTKKITLADN